MGAEAISQVGGRLAGAAVATGVVALGAAAVAAGIISAPITVPASVIIAGGVVIGGFINYYVGETVEDVLNNVWDYVETKFREIGQQDGTQTILVTSAGALDWGAGGYQSARQSLLENGFSSEGGSVVPSNLFSLVPSTNSDVIVESSTANSTDLMAGDDYFVMSQAPSSANGGEGRDTYDASYSNAPVRVDLGNGYVELPDGTRVSVKDFEVAVGSSYDDRATGSASDNRLLGQGGNDLLLGLGGDDELVGGEGNDELIDGLGNNILVGGSGQDRGVTFS